MASAELSRRVEKVVGYNGEAAKPGYRLGMPAIAEHVCQSCERVTWGPVPTRMDTMPACQCGGRRQIVRIRHKAAERDDLAERLAAERARA